MSLPEFSTRYPVTVSMLTLAVALLGAISLDKLGTDLLPNVHTPVISVDLQVPGKAPQEVEERYTRRLERDISTISGVDRVYSITRSGQSVVVAEFDWEADMDFALIDVQKKMGVYATDEDIESLDVVQEDPQALPVMRIAVSPTDDYDLDALLGAIETVVKPKLEALNGVASADVEGDAEKEIRVTLDPYLLEAFGQDADAVIAAITSANEDVSGGTLREAQQSYQVKGLGRLADMQDVRDVIIGARQGVEAAEGEAAALQVPVYVQDVGTVALQYEDRETIVRLDGVECIGLAVYKEADANTVQVVSTVLQALDDLDLDLPDLRFAVVENQARFIEEAVAEVEEAALHGALLAIVVLFFFLRSWTATLVIGLAIPISILATFTLMFFEGLTLNIMTLGGLALGAGMLVDNAIVVIENIYRHLERGEGAAKASAKGASEVGVAIMASTLTTVSVFLPIVYLQGLTSELFKDQAWTVAFSLVSSLAVAMVTVPMLTSRFLRGHAGVNTAHRWLRFRAFLNGVLDRKTVVLLIVCASVAGTVYVAPSIQTEFIPREDQGLFHIDLALAEGSRLEVTDRVATRVGQIVGKIGGDEVAAVYARSGVDPARLANIGDPTGPNRATLSVSLATGQRRSLTQLVGAIDRELSEIPELQVEYQLHETALEGMMGEQAAPLQIEIVGDDIEVLRHLCDELKARVMAQESVYNVSTSFQGGQPELDLRLREDAVVATGLTVGSILQSLERRLSGEVVGELAKDQRSRDIRVGFERVDLHALPKMRIDTPDGAMLALGDLADPEIVEGPREILREDQRRVGRVLGYLVEGAVLGEAIGQIEQVVADMEMPRGYRIEIGGEERERKESFADLQFALLLSVLLVYMVMASLFESLLHPFTVMLTVPLAGVGVVWAFWGLGEPLSVMAYIGIIMLGGIAVNDSIVLVDRIKQLREQLPTVREAILQGTQDRMRPIMMTTATTILALAPMAVGLGEGAGLRAPMAIAVIGGLCSSTLVALVVIPVVYETFERLRGEPTA